jgi:voltage-gated potassium channel
MTAQTAQTASNPTTVSFRRRIYDVLDVQPDDRGYERVVNISLLALIIANVMAVVLETVQSLYAEFRVAFDAFEAISVAIFSCEYLLRLWSCTSNPRYAHPLWGRLRFAISFLALVDLVSILPSLIPGGSLDLRFVRSLRLLRLSRTLKIARYSQSLQTLGRVLRHKREELFITVLAGGVVLICAASLMYYAERDAQPQQFSSIPAAAWWGVATLTTVGYGDIYPVTPMGKVLGAMIALLGIGLFALPAGILASGFSEELHRPKAATCPRCGAEL